MPRKILGFEIIAINTLYQFTHRYNAGKYLKLSDNSDLSGEISE